MGRPRHSPSEPATTERLLEAAMDEFAALGFNGARLEDIAQRAGIRRPSLLYHFPSKEALYAAVVRRAFVRLNEALFAALSREGPLVTRLERTAQHFARYLEENPALAHLLVRELLDRRGPGADLLLTEVVPLLDRLEGFVSRESGRPLSPDLPIRPAMMQLASSALLRAVAGPLRQALWGPDDFIGAVVRALFPKEC